jgi:hypothetical protein
MNGWITILAGKIERRISEFANKFASIRTDLRKPALFSNGTVSAGQHLSTSPLVNNLVKIINLRVSF